ncbi:MAG: hypothetical protein IT184_06680 [Acidobacteria bacterium]|nr:hypothetical protein [Acidobacteriota bacterium]
MKCTAIVILAGLLLGPVTAAQAPGSGAFLDDHLVVTWYGNPRTSRMGVLGATSGPERAESLRRQAKEYAALTPKRIVMAYHLIAVIAQPDPGRDGRYRRRETRETIQAMLDEARANGFRLVLDIQPGHSTVAEEVQALAPFLGEPEVDLALDPEFTMPDETPPGRKIGTMRAADVNAAIDALESIVRTRRLPRKMLIVHQFTHNMLPDKPAIRRSSLVDVVLNMDGFGSPSLKRSTWRFVMREPLAYTGFKLFYKQDTDLMSPAEVLALQPTPSVVVYQ